MMASKEVYFLNQVANQKYPEDFSQNLIQTNKTIASISKYLIKMQGGIDDLDKDIVETVQDFIHEIIVIFGGGSGGDSGFEFGDLKYIFQAIGGLFGLGNIGAGFNLFDIAGNFFNNFLKPIQPFIDSIRVQTENALSFILDLIAGIPFVGNTISQKIASVLNLSWGKATAAETQAVAVGSAVAAGAIGQIKPSTADQAAYDAAKALYDLAAQTQADVVAIRQNESASGGGALQKSLMFPNGPVNTTDLTVNPSEYVYNGQLALAGGLANGFYRAKINYLYTTDTQAINGSLGDNGNAYSSFLILRAFSDYNSGVGVRITNAGIQIGTVDGFGTNPNFFTSVSGLGRTMTSSDNVELRASGNVFVVLVNGTPVLSYNGALGGVGSSYRNSFVIKQKTTEGAFQIVNYSFNFRSIGIYDFGGVGASITDRIACRIIRLTTGAANVSVLNGTTGTFPAGFFTSTEFATGTTVTDLSSGTVRSDINEWYEFSAGFAAHYGVTPGSGQGNISWWGDARWTLFVKKAADADFNPVSPALPVGLGFKYPLSQGDVCQARIANVEQSVNGPANTGDSSIGRSSTAAVDQVGGGPGTYFQMLVDK